MAEIHRHFNMLFLAVVKDFDFFAKMKIQFKRGMVHCNTEAYNYRFYNASNKYIPSDTSFGSLPTSLTFS